MAVQVSGKLLGTIQVEKGAPAAVVRAAIEVVEGFARSRGKEAGGEGHPRHQPDAELRG